MTAQGKAKFDLDTASVSASLDRVNKDADKFNAVILKSVGSIATIGTAITAVSGIWGQFSQAVEKTIQRIEDAADRVQGGARSRARALSLATSIDERNRISAGIDATRRETGLDESRASDLQFQVESLGLSSRRADIARLENLGQDSTAFARGLSRVSRVLGISGESLGRVADEIFVASRESESSADQLAEAIAQAAPLAKETGSNVQELAALFGGVGGDELAQIRTGFRGLSRGLIRQGITEGGILSGVDQLAERDLRPAQLQRLLGDEGFIAFQLIQSQRESINRVAGQLPGAGGAIANAVSLVQGDPRVGFTQAVAREQAKLDITEETTSGINELNERRRELLVRNAGGTFSYDLAGQNVAEALFLLTGGSFDDNSNFGGLGFLNGGNLNPGFGLNTQEEQLKALQSINAKVGGPATYQAGSQEREP